MPFQEGNKLGIKGRPKIYSKKEYRVRRIASQTSYNYNLKKLVFDYYGWKCKCCSETCHTFLTIDHVKNDGRKDVNSMGNKVTGVSLHKRIIDLGYPVTYQILCWNCNLGKSLNGGVCPHNTN